MTRQTSRALVIALLAAALAACAPGMLLRGGFDGAAPRSALAGAGEVFALPETSCEADSGPLPPVDQPCDLWLRGDLSGAPGELRIGAVEVLGGLGPSVDGLSGAMSLSFFSPRETGDGVRTVLLYQPATERTDLVLLELPGDEARAFVARRDCRGDWCSLALAGRAPLDMDAAAAAGLSPPPAAYTCTGFAVTDRAFSGACEIRDPQTFVRWLEALDAAGVALGPFDTAYLVFRRAR